MSHNEVAAAVQQAAEDSGLADELRAMAASRQRPADQVDGLPDDPAILKDAIRQLMATLQQQQAQQPFVQRWYCAVCINTLKLKTNEIQPKWKALGLEPTSPEGMQAWAVLMQEAQVTDPRLADTMANGNYVCMQCFQPSKTTSLLPGAVGMSMRGPGGPIPGRGLPGGG